MGGLALILGGFVGFIAGQNAKKQSNDVALYPRSRSIMPLADRW
jgi:hypothetical protein